FEFLPQNMHAATPVPENEDDRKAWLAEWYCEMLRERRERFDPQIVADYGSERAATIEYVEVYEISEYARRLDETRREQLFPFLSQT
ncbi:MAG: hypothetical protein VB817_08455, partial [Pirellulaceae bacterium]